VSVFRRASLPLVVAAILTMGINWTTASAAGGSMHAQSPARAETGLRHVVTHRSLLGTHVWYDQVFRGVPVLGGYLARHVMNDGRTVVDDGRRPVPANLSVTPRVPRTQAIDAAVARVRGSNTVAALAVLPGTPARLVWRAVSDTPAGSVETLVDATSGSVVSVRSLVQNANGKAKVFDPNPVVTLQDESLTDQNDQDYPGLAGAYKSVTLTNLDGTGFLRGDYVNTDLGGKTAFSKKEKFNYGRDDDRFEQALVYYQLTQAQRYIQSLGFNDINNEAQDVRPDDFTGDNSFYDESHDRITYGIGGVDDAEDAEIVWHEYGHAMQDDQVPGFGLTEEAGAIGEGFGDYWAVTMSQPVSGGFDLPCVGDWDSVSYTPPPTHCLRRTDLDLTIEDKDGEVHDDGQIWSRALWDINQGLGREKADTIILEATFDYSPSTSFAAAAQVTVATAKALYGKSAARVCKKAFKDRHILSA
jgi:Zn-dependent metalloprotease